MGQGVPGGVIILTGNRWGRQVHLGGGSVVAFAKRGDMLVGQVRPGSGLGGLGEGRCGGR